MAISFIEKLKDLISPRNEKGQQPYQEASQKASIKDAYQNVSQPVVQTTIKESQMNFIILLPIIINAIKAVEELLPNSPGKEKFDFVVQTLETVTGAAVDNLPALEKYVSVIVSMLKVLGIFKAKTPA